MPDVPYRDVLRTMAQELKNSPVSWFTAREMLHVLAENERLRKALDELGSPEQLVFGLDWTPAIELRARQVYAQEALACVDGIDAEATA